MQGHTLNLRGALLSKLKARQLIAFKDFVKGYLVLIFNCMYPIYPGTRSNVKPYPGIGLRGAQLISNQRTIQNHIQNKPQLLSNCVITQFALIKVEKMVKDSNNKIMKTD